MIEQQHEARSDVSGRSRLPSFAAGVLDALPDAVFAESRDGLLVYANRAGRALLGLGSRELPDATATKLADRLDLLDERGHPAPSGQHPGTLALEGRTVQPVAYRLRLVEPAGDVVAIVSAAPLAGDDGSIDWVVMTVHEPPARSFQSNGGPEPADRYEDLIEAMPDVAWATNSQGVIVAANQRWSSYTGKPARGPDALEAEGWVHPQDLARLVDRRTDQFAPGDVFEVTCRLRRHDGVYRWHLLRTAPRRSLEGTIQAWIGTATDIDDAKRAEESLRMLARATAQLDATLDPGETTVAAVSIAVSDLADWCIVDLLAEDGTVSRAAVAAADPTQRGLIEALRSFPTDPNREGLGSVALRTGRPVLLQTVTEEDIDRIARSDEHGRILRELAPTSIMSAPLTAHGRTLGVILLSASRSGRRYDPVDVDLATELAGRVAMAISNAQLYAGEQRAREAAEASAERTARLQRLTRMLTAAMSRDDVIDIVLREGVSALDAHGGAVARLTPDGASLEVVRSAGLAPDRAERRRQLPLSARAPLADVTRTREPVWLPRIGDADVDAADLKEVIKRSPNASLCALPITVEGRVLGAFGLVFPEFRAFDEEDRRYIAAYADLCGQALDRVGLAEARETLLGNLEEERRRLETVIRQMPAGVILVEAPSGRILLANKAVREILGALNSPLESLEQFEQVVSFYPDGQPYKPEDWPVARAIRAGEVVVDEEMELRRTDGTREWLLTSAAPIHDRDGQILAGVVTFTNQTERRRRQESQRFLADASAILGDSLDVERTISELVQAAVPWIGDWCAVDLVEPDQQLRRVAVASGDSAHGGLDASLFPVAGEPETAMGPAAVVSTGRAELVEEVGDTVLPDRAGGHRVRSWMSLPLVTGRGVVGAVTLASGESGRRFGQDDLAFAESLAARIAGAVERAGLFRDAGRYKRLVDASLDAVFIIDPVSLRYQYVNDGAVEQLGLDRLQLLGMGPQDVAVDLAEDRLRGLLAPILQGAMESRTLSIAHRHATGRSIPVEVLLQRVDIPGEDSRIVAIARDITDRVETQVRLQRLAEAEHARARELNAVIGAFGEGLVVCDQEGRITLSNPAAHGLFPGAAGRTYADILQRLHEPNGAPPLGTRGGPVELRLKDEEERWVEISTYPVVSQVGIRGDGKAGSETIVVLRDATQARQRQAIRDTFLGVLSHELRTPITTIFAASKVLSRPDSTLSPDLRREIFEDVRVEAERLHRLVEDVIALQRFGEDQGDVGNEPVLLQRIIPGVIRSEQARWTGATFVADIPPGLPTVIADATYVEQVVRNLLSNAAKYGSSTSVVETVIRAEEGEVCVRILDRGPGFAVEEADRLFELFYRSPLTAGTASGAGIGLFVCARLIRAMGGRIWARPRDEGGAEFGFSLAVMLED